MKAKRLIGIYLALLVLAWGCKKSAPEPRTTQQSAQQAQVSEPVAAEPSVQPAKTDESSAQQIGQENADQQQTPSLDEPNDTGYFAVFMEGKKVGHAIHRRWQRDGKVTTSESVKITISRLNVPITINMLETHLETAEGKPLGFEVVQELSAMSSKVTGVIEPNGTVNLVTSSMGVEQKSTMPWPEGALMAEGLRLLSEQKGLTAGAEYTVRAFSAGVLGAIDTTVRVGLKKNVDLLGRVVSLHEVTSSYTMPMAGQIVSMGYVDDEFTMQKYTMPVAGINVEIVACAKEFALGQDDVLDLVHKMFVKSPVPLDDLGEVKSITYYMKPTGDGEFNIPSGDNQTVEKLADGTIVLTVQPVAPPGETQIPYRGRDKALLQAIEPTRFLQSDDHAIIKLAHEAVGQTTDAAKAVKKIETFVADYIANANLSVGYASAAEVAACKQGDCTEFAVLTAALCRAAGIPAQVVVGIAYVKGYSGLEGFGGHAWVQAYVGDRWVGLDAAFKSSGRGGYDPGHIALAVGNGEPADFFNIATTLGQFKIEKLTIQKK